MIRPVIDNKETTTDIIEARFFKTSVKKHKKRIIQRSRYADENPLLTAGFVLIIIVSFGFLLVGNIASAKTKQFENEDSYYNSGDPEIIKTKDSDKANDSESDNKVTTNVSDSTKKDNNLSRTHEISVPVSNPDNENSN